MQIIKIYFNTGKTASGKAYKVPHTTAWGFDMTVQLNGNMSYYQGEDGEYYVQYDPKKAGVKVNSNGYLVLNIID